MNAAVTASDAQLRAMIRRHFTAGDPKLVGLVRSLRIDGELTEEVGVSTVCGAVVHHVRIVLESLACVGQRTTYALFIPLVPAVTFNLGITQDRNALAETLRLVSEQSVATDGFMLSVLVGSSHDWMPSKGFRTLAEDLGKLQSGASFVHFYTKELGLVHSHYTKKRRESQALQASSDDADREGA